MCPLVIKLFSPSIKFRLGSVNLSEPPSEKPVFPVSMRLLRIVSVLIENFYTLLVRKKPGAHNWLWNKKCGKNAYMVVTKTFIGVCVFMYSCSARRVSFQTKFKSVGPPINVLVMALNAEITMSEKVAAALRYDVKFITV